LKSAYLRFHVNSPNLNPIFHIFIFLVDHLFPIWIITSYDKKVIGTTELRVLIRFSEV